MKAALPDFCCFQTVKGGRGLKKSVLALINLHFWTVHLKIQTLDLANIRDVMVNLNVSNHFGLLCSIQSTWEPVEDSFCPCHMQNVDKICYSKCFVIAHKQVHFLGQYWVMNSSQHIYFDVLSSDLPFDWAVIGQIVSRCYLPYWNTFKYEQVDWDFFHSLEPQCAVLAREFIHTKLKPFSESHLFSPLSKNLFVMVWSGL